MSATNIVVANTVERIRRSAQFFQDEWVDERGQMVAWVDERVSARIIVARRAFSIVLTASFEAHPAVFVLDEEERSHYAAAPEVALASWVLEDGALDAMLAAGVDAAYARAAHAAGVTDAWTIIDGWTADIPVEYLGAAS